jgi:hypothetical protein
MSNITEKDLKDIKDNMTDEEEITIETLEELSNGKGDDNE